MKVILNTIIILLFFFSGYRMVGENVAFGAYGAYFLFGFLTISPILFKRLNIKYNKTLMILLSLYTFATVISSFVNSEVGMLFHSIMFFLLFMSTVVIINSYYEDSGEIVTKGVFIANMPLIIIPLILHGVETSPYRGMFLNPNTFGMMVATIFTIFASIFFTKTEKIIFHKEQVSKNSILFTLTLALFCFWLIVISASRTSFLAAIITVFVGFLSLVLSALKYKRFTSLSLKLLIRTPLLIITYIVIDKFTPLNQYIENVIISKFQRKSSNLLDGREIVWLKTVSDARLFGNGESYFDTQVGLGAHNTFIHILAVYGWVPLLIFIIMSVVSLYYCTNFAMKSDSDYKYLPIMMLLTFFALSMGENQMYKITMIIAFVLAGLASNNRKIIFTTR